MKVYQSEPIYIKGSFITVLVGILCNLVAPYILLQQLSLYQMEYAVTVLYIIIHVVSEVSVLSVKLLGSYVPNK